MKLYFSPMLRITGGGNDTEEPVPEEKYKASAVLAHYKNILNEKLKEKNPEAFANYFKGLVEARRTGNQQLSEEYIQKAPYNEYLSPEEARKTLGEKGYQRYLGALKTVNEFNIQQKQRPLYGEVEGEGDINNLNYGRRFASLQVVPSLGVSREDSASGQRKSYSRNYMYDPATDEVKFEESGDVELRPDYLSRPQQKVKLRVSK